MHSELSIEVAAPPERVYRLARDVTRWARLLPHYSRSRAVETRPDGSVVAEFVARRALPGPLGVLGLAVPVAWRSRTWHEPDTRRLRFVHQGGATAGMDVTWTIESTDDVGHACRVTIAHDFAPRFAPWSGFIDRWFTRAIAGRTLATFKALAETLEEPA